MQIYSKHDHKRLSRASSGSLSTTGKNILGSLERAGTKSTVGSEISSQMTPSVFSKPSVNKMYTPLLDYYKNRDRHPNKIQKSSQFAPPSMTTIMTPIITKSVNESDRLYSSVANGDKYSTFTPRNHLTHNMPLVEPIAPSFKRSKMADFAVYKNGDRNTFNDSHFYLGFSSTKRNQLASSLNIPKDCDKGLYKDTESVNGLYDKPNHSDM